MDARTGLPWAGVDSHRSYEAQEYGHDPGMANATATRGHEEVVVLRDSSTFQVSCEARSRRWMQRHKAALVKLGFPNNQTVIRDVVETKIQRFGNAQSGDGQQ